MLFNYKTISVSRNVQLDIVLIREHQKSIIENANLLANQTLIHNEEIDDSLITLTAENVNEQRLLNGEFIQNEFYYDSTRDKYLGLSTTVVNFYIDGTNKKNIYMYQIAGISSSAVPHSVFEDYCLIAIEGYSQTSIPNLTDIIQIEDVQGTPTTLLTITNNTGGAITEFFDDTYDITIPTGTKLASYIMNFGMDNPVLKVYLKKIYTPI